MSSNECEKELKGENPDTSTISCKMALLEITPNQDAAAEAAPTTASAPTLTAAAPTETAAVAAAASNAVAEVQLAMEKATVNSESDVNEKCNAASESSRSRISSSSGSSISEKTNPQIPKQLEQSDLSQKIASLQEKTKILREKLNIGRRELQNQQLVVQHCEKTRQQNNDSAAQSMNNVSSKVKVDKSNRAKKDSNVATTATAAFESGKHGAIYVPRCTRLELEEQVEGLQELLCELVLKNPQLEMRAWELANKNPKLQKVPLFQTAKQIIADKLAVRAHGRNNHFDYKAQQPRRQKESKSTVASGKRLEGGGLRERHQSEMSNASSTLSPKDTTTVSSSSAEAKKARKRNARAKKKTAQQTKCQASEEEALAKYINTIVSEYLGENKERAVELEFKGGVDDLEAYAQRLVQAGLGRVVEEEIRINRKNNRQSFITMCTDREGPERDGIVLLPVARRYAFEGDTVRAFVMKAGAPTTINDNGVAAEAAEAKKMPPKEETITGGKENSFCIADDEDPFPIEDSDLDPNELDAGAVTVSDNCPKSFVISIVKKTDLREVVGTISFKNPIKLNDERAFYKLKPHDMRVPMVYIPEDACGAHITEESKKDICGFLYLAHVRETDVNGHCIGELVQPVGKVGNLEAEIKAILLHNGMKDIRPYEQRFNDLYAEPDPPISAEELKRRKDLRKDCIFTIDPLTARDLDDAMSIEELDDGLYEVGVHISDVSYYLEEDSELDNIVKARATSIYLVNEVIHMLPQTLCFKCSLLPGEDKFAFSVFWQLNAAGEIIGEPSFTRSVINSCSQFAYEHAQKIIDNPDETFSEDDFPTICNGFTPDDVAWRVRTLNTLARQMRQKRYDAGALSINNPKLRFTLDAKSGEPMSYNVDEREEANFLIEEFMLLANQSVARYIYDRFPDAAILRNHAPPLAKSMKALREKLSSLGMEFDASSSKTVYASMQRICNEAADPTAMDACLSTLLTKPMARAKYFCSEGKTEESDLWHYALSIPIYTHFTSPIRRYPDVLVHRLLAAALNYCPPPKRSIEELHSLAKVCNDQKFNAKNAGDESINLFFKRYIKAKQYIVLRAVVMEIFQHLTNVVTIETGHVIAIYYKMQKVLVDTSNVPAHILISEKNSKNAPLKLQMFSTVDVKLVIWDDKICGFFVSPDPKQRQLNSIELSKKKQLQQQQKANNGNNGSRYVENKNRKQRQLSQSSSVQEQIQQSPQQQQQQQQQEQTPIKAKSKNNPPRTFAVRN